MPILLSNLFFYSLSEIFGKYVWHKEMHNEDLHYYRLWYGAFLVLVSVFFIVRKEFGDLRFIFLIFLITMVRIFVMNQLSEEDLKSDTWYSSRGFRHVPIGIGLSLIIVSILFYHHYTRFLWVLIIITFFSNLYFYHFTKTKEKVLSIPICGMIVLDIVLEVVSLNRPDSAPGVLIQEIIEICFFWINRKIFEKEISKSNTKSNTKKDKGSFFTYFSLCAADLIIESYRSSSTITLIHSYISETIVYWGSYLIEYLLEN